VNVLVVAPHPDDEALGCGGAVLAHVAGGDRVTAVFLTSGEHGLATYPVDEARRVREEEASKAAAVLGLAAIEFLRLPDGSLSDHTDSLGRSVAAHLHGVDFVDVVYVPHPGDDHEDHRSAWSAVADSVGTGVEVLGYELWTPIARPDRIVDISAHMPRKLEAVRCYASQLEYWPYDRAVEGLNAYRGALFEGSGYAEAFTLVRPA
jgi:LmbE family N-acetylglucosaminyl deacetylase